MLADKLPAMCGSETFTTVVSSTSMKVANITATAMIHGLMCRCCSSAIPLSRIDRGCHRHSRPQEMIRILSHVQHDLDRHALDNFHEISGRVFRRQQAEPRAGGGRDTV